MCIRDSIERATILADGDAITSVHLVTDLPSRVADENPASSAAKESGFLIEEPISLAELERRYLRWIDSRFSGDREALAHVLGIGKRTLYRKMGELRDSAAGAGKE